MRAVLAAGLSILAVGLSPFAKAATLRQGSNATASGSVPGQVLWGYYQTAQPRGFLCPPHDNVSSDLLCNVGGSGDNILRLVNPNGAANGNLAGAKTQTVCAMIYMFDDDEEMGECCGCPLSSSRLATFSIENNLTSNWGIQNIETYGAIAIVAAAPNAPAVPPVIYGQGCAVGQSAACNGGCDPTNLPGYSITTANNLLGSISHTQAVAQPLSSGEFTAISGITELPLSDDAGGDPNNAFYLQAQCGALVGNGTGGGICNCPVE
jgi:hypothetical protein